MLVLLLGGVAAYKFIDNQPREIIGGSYLPDEKDAKKMSKEERKKANEKEVDESKFTLSIYPEATFKNGEAIGDIYIRNEVENAYPMLLKLLKIKQAM